MSRRRRVGVPGGVLIREDGIAVEGTVVAWADVNRLTLVMRHRFGIPLPAPRWAFVVDATSGPTVVVDGAHSEGLLAWSWRLEGFDHAAARAALRAGRTSLTILYERLDERCAPAGPPSPPARPSERPPSVRRRRWGRGLTW